MSYEEIREARLRQPFVPFWLRMKNGKVHFISEPERLALSPKVLVFLNESHSIVYSSSDEVASLVVLG